MNKFSSSCILFILLISSPWIIAQNKDCETALEVCGNAPLHFVPAPGEGLPDSDIGNSCVELEFNSMWVKWTVIQSGIITFVITPDSMQDIDFVVFRSESDFDCSNKTEIRCMAAGSTGGPPHEWANCAGATGDRKS